VRSFASNKKKMKKALLVLLIGISSQASAQFTHQVSFGTGLGGVIAEQVGPETYAYSFAPVYYVQFSQQHNAHVYFNEEVNYMTYHYIAADDNISYNIQKKCYSALAGFTFFYRGDARPLQFYSGIRVGGMMESSFTTSRFQPTNQAMMLAGGVTFMGIRVGGRLAGFAELGTGDHGLVNGGICFRY
jgi:hypothetical protein